MPSAIDVYIRGFREVIVLPHERVVQMPPPRSRAKARLVLCCDFAEKQSCARGADCRFVHADVKGLPRRRVHVNYAWRSVDDVVYERLPPGRRLPVALPNSTNDAPHEVIESQYILRTRAFDHPRRLVHCAHYFFNRSCHLGSDCCFVHGVYIDPRAAPHQLAPGPSQIKANIVSKRQLEASLRGTQVASSDDEDNDDDAEYQMTDSNRLSADSSSIRLPTAGPAVSLNVTMRRWRHNPYTTTTSAPLL